MSETPDELTPGELADVLDDQEVGSAPNPYQGDDYDTSQQDPEAVVPDDDEDSDD